MVEKMFYFQSVIYEKFLDHIGVTIGFDKERLTLWKKSILKRGGKMFN